MLAFLLAIVAVVAASSGLRDPGGGVLSTAAGGSIARVDRLGLLKVGPRSAGAEPGPVCYGLGGEEPDRALNATRGLATHEMVVRAQYKAWLGYMREAA